MPIGVPTFCGERLREARIARGLFKKTLGDMLGVTGTAVTRWEEGLDNPQPEKFDALIKILQFSPEFFTRPAWPEKLEPIFWRSQASESKSAREMTEQRMRWACEIFFFLEEMLEFPALDLPRLDLPDDYRLYTSEDIERAAETAREAWNLKAHPIPDVSLAIENVGIPIIQLEIPSDKQDGFCFRSAHLKRPFVGINTYQVSAARVRYDAAHELGHALLHTHVTLEQSRDPAGNKLQEQQAHRFAGAFLFPRRAFVAEVRSISLDYFCSLKKRWGMSIAAMIYRAFNLGLIDEHERTALYQGMARRRWRGQLREPFDAPGEMPMERPRMLRRGIEVLLTSEIFGIATLKAQLPIPELELEAIAGLDNGALVGPEPSISITARETSLSTRDLESGNVVEFRRRR